MRLKVLFCIPLILAGCTPHNGDDPPKKPVDEYAHDARDAIPNDVPLPDPLSGQRPVVGVKKILVSVIHWQDGDVLNDSLIQHHTVSSDPDSLRSYILAASGGKLTLDGRMISYKSGPRPDMCKSGSPMPISLATSEGEKAARASGLDPASFDYLINVIDCGGNASAWVPGRIMGVYGQAGGPHVYKHEFGHNLGYNHGSTYTKCSKVGDTVHSPEGCSTVPYGDTGDSVSGGGTLYPANNRWYSGWIDSSQSAVIERTGLYRLGVLGSAGPQVYFINRQGSSPAQIALEYRKPNFFENYPPTDNRVNGVWVRYTTMGGSLVNTQLDGTPETATTNDPTLLPGRALVDPAAVIHVCSADAAGATITVALNNEARPSCTPDLARPSVETPKPGETGYRPIVSGTGQPGTTVQIRRMIGVVPVGSPVGSAIVGANGQWSTQIDNALPAGIQALAVHSTNPGSAPSGSVGGLPFKVIEIPNPPAIQTPQSNVTTNPFPVFSGKGLPGATVFVERVRDNVLVGVVAKAVVDAEGNWSAQSQYKFAVGRGEVASYQLNGDKRSESTAVLTFNVIGSFQRLPD